MTFSSTSRAAVSGVNQANGLVETSRAVKSADRIELRESDGTIVRLGKGTSFVLEETPLGVRPIYGDGPVLIIKKGGCGKIRTSCWMAEANATSVRPDVFITPGDSPGEDHFYALSGDIVIYEFDEQQKSFVICTVDEGCKAIMNYNDSAPSIRNRYKAKIVPFTDAEYKHILDNYIDRRNWV